MSWLSLLRTAKWPPFLSFSVLWQHSIMKGLSSSAKKVRSSKSKVAPRLSEFDTNIYFIPSARSWSNFPDPVKAAYKSPWPGGHHSTPGLIGQTAGAIVLASTLGTLFCINSRFGSATISGYFSRNFRVSSDVEKEFISMNLTLLLKDSLIAMHCFAVKSRKVFCPLTGRRDLALSKPILVPNPPFNFRTTVSFNKSVLTEIFPLMSS
mmetsp:Transcript_1075/g.1401  ORF Transcript_1075/g.1401 Transcript_1075/m.1401 type:complete len:208 (+) Transcript_1075:2852-3475(+)